MLQSFLIFYSLSNQSLYNYTVAYRTFLLAFTLHVSHDFFWPERVCLSCLKRNFSLLDKQSKRHLKCFHAQLSACLNNVIYKMGLSFTNCRFNSRSSQQNLCCRNPTGSDHRKESLGNNPFKGIAELNSHLCLLVFR